MRFAEVPLPAAAREEEGWIAGAVRAARPSRQARRPSAVLLAIDDSAAAQQLHVFVNGKDEPSLEAMRKLAESLAVVISCARRSANSPRRRPRSVALRRR